MAKKQRIKNEDPSINFRLSPDLKKWITSEAISENKTVSNYLRDHLTSFMDGSLYAENVSWYQDKEFINSTSFLQLVAFVFSKRNNSTCVSTDDQMDWHIKTIKQLDRELPKELVIEFDKVLVDLMRVKKEKKSYSTITIRFKFCKDSYSTVFNYDLLENYLLNVLKPYHVVILNSEK